MSRELWRELQRTLAVIEHVQKEVGEIYIEKGAALRQVRILDLESIADRESKAVDRLRASLALRNSLLSKARLAGFRVDSLGALAEILPVEAPEERGLVLRQLSETRQRAGRLQQESWTHWIVAHQSHRHYSELLELIAQGGQRSPIYHERSGKGADSVGALLDTSI